MGSTAAEAVPRETPQRRNRRPSASPHQAAGKTVTDEGTPFRRARWYAVQCQSHREPGAALQLRNQGFQVFLPLRPKTWRHARRIETRHVPFFPGYLFVKLDLARDPWRSVNGTLGVKQLVTAGAATPAALPRGFIEALRHQADDRGCLRLQGRLRIGEEVRILAGPFGDRMGELIDLDDSGRVRVLIELLGGRIPAVLSRGDVMAAS